MTTKDLIAKANAIGLESSHFDDEVHEAAIQLAADINNLGMDAQIEFLEEQLGYGGVDEFLDSFSETQDD
jgi:hypothetical protein